MKAFVRSLLVVALAGVACVLGIHIASLIGISEPFEKSIPILFPILFVVWAATVLTMNRLTRDFKQKDIWKAALRGCPTWMRRAVWVVFGYSWLGFFVLPILFGGGMSSKANGARMGSATILAFYTVAAAVLYSALNAEHFDSTRRCLNGHSVQPLAKFCDECGAPVRSEPAQSDLSYRQ